MGLGADWVCAGWGLIARQQCTPLNPASPRLGSGVRIECGIWVRIGFAQARGSLTGVRCCLESPQPGSAIPCFWLDAHPCLGVEISKLEFRKTKPKTTRNASNIQK